MKLLWITPSYYPNIDGMSKVSTEYVYQLRNLGYFVEVISTNTEAYKNLTNGNLTIRKFSLSIFFSRKNIKKIIEEFDYIIVCGVQYNPADLFLFYGKKKVIYFSHCVSWNSGINSNIIKGLIRRINYVLYNFVGSMLLSNNIAYIFLGSGNLNDRTMDQKYIGKNPLLILPNCSNYKKIQKTNYNFSKKQIILFVGAFTKEKGALYILELSKKLDEIKSELIVCTLSNSIAEVHLNILRNNNVNIVLDVSNENLYQYYKLADVLVSFSLSECFPLTITDALACGLPVVSTPSGYISVNPGVMIVNSFFEALYVLKNRTYSIPEEVSIKSWSEGATLISDFLISLHEN